MEDTIGTILGILIIAFLLVALGVGIWIYFRAVLITWLAQKDLLFTFRKEGHIKYLVEGSPSEGGRLIKYIYLIKGKYIDQDTGNILDLDETTKDKDESKPTWSERVLGAYWIGIPPRRILEYNITYIRPLRPGDEHRRDEKPDNYIIDTKHSMVTRFDKTKYHAYRQIYSVYVQKVEVKGFEIIDEKGTPTRGQAQVDIWGTFTLLTSNARIPVLELNGQWFPHITDIISGTISDFVNDETLETVRSIDKVTNQKDAAGNPVASKFEQAILDASFGPSGTKGTTGLEIKAFNTSGIEVEDRAEKTLRERALASVDADTRRIKGKGEGDYAKEKGTGEAAAYAAKAKAIADNPNIVPVLVSENDARGMEGLRGTFVRGNSRETVVAIPSTQNPQLPPTPPKDSQDPKDKTEGGK